MSTYRLTCFGQSGNAYKPALYLALSGADWEPVFINFMKGAHREPEFLEKNEMGQVPILEHGDKCLSQSGVILDYLVEKIGKFGWNDADERREVLRWLFWDNYSFTSILAPLRFLGHFVPEDKRDPGAMKFLQQRMANALRTLDKRLEGREWVALDRPTIADLSIAGYIYYGDELPFDLSEYPNVVAWKDRLAALPGWKPPYELMPTQG